MLQRLARGTALLAGVFCAAAYSLGLGDIQVGSRLNQPLSATIPLSSLSEEDAESLRVQLASPADFEKAGIERSDYLSSLKFSVSGSRVAISSSEIAREPYIALLVEARAGGSRVLRGYTVLLDLPASASADPAATASSQPPANADAAATESARQQQPKTYGPIRSGQTFWSVSTKLRPDPALVSQDQTMLALYNANPQAFLGGINGLLIGSTLQVPSIEQMRSVPELEARRRVQVLRAASSAPGTLPAAEPAKPAVVVTPEAPPAAPVVEAETPISAAPPADTAAAAPESPISAEPAPPTPTVDAPPAAVEVTVPPPEAGAGEAAEASADAAVPPPAETPAAPAVPVAAAAPALSDFPLYPLIGGLILLVLLVMLLLRRRRAAVKAPPSRLATAPVAATAATAAAAEAEVPPVADTASEPAAFADTAADATVAVIAPPVIEVLVEAPPFEAEVPPPDADESQPVEIDLAAPVGGSELALDQLDAIAEADFHLSYGLYDEAVRGLSEAIAREPDRNDLQIKLAETYFAAGRPDDFEALAQRLQPRLSAPEWSRLMFMGSQLCPDSALFRDADAEPLPVQADYESAPPENLGHHVEFTLEPLPDLPPPVPAQVDTGNRLEFELSQFDASAPVDVASWHSPVPSQTQWQPPAAPAVLDLANPREIEFDALPDIDPDDIDLFDPEPEGDIATDDEVGTKLDLARAYLDMGDNQMARDLLAEVAVQGSAAQQADAEALLQRLPS